MRMRGFRRVGVVGAVLVPALVAMVVAAPTAFAGTSDRGGDGGGHRDGDGDRVVSERVSFDVVTSNHSGVPCLAGPVERHVTVRGHLTGPEDKLRDGVDGALYSHGNGYGEFFWRFGSDSSDSGFGDDYNVVRKLADKGHVSVTIDRLGYGASDKPNGNDICFGTEADVLHQIIGQLRGGDYHGDRTPRFDRIGLLGHSASGIIAEQEAAGFHDIDALGVLSSGELNAGPLIVQRTAEFSMRCAAEPSLPLLPAIGDGYAPLEADEAQFRSDHFHNIDDRIADAVAARRTDDACAGLRNAPAAIAADPVRNGTITVPVLFLIGKNDAFFAGASRLQADTYRSSVHVTFVELPDTGHTVAFGRTADQWRTDLHNWLQDNRL